MVRFEVFNRKHGLIRPEYLTMPRLSDMVQVEFPTGSVIHYLPESDVDEGPEPTWWMIRQTAGDVWVEHITEFQATHGKTTPITGSPQNFIRRYHQRFPSLKKVLNRDAALRNATSTLVINHALARHYVKYQGTQFIEYSRNRNIRDNVFAEVAKIVKEVDRQHFIPVRMPTSFPVLNQIQKAEAEEILTIESVKRFTSLERLMFLELWRWLGDPGPRKGADGKDAPRGVLSLITQIPEDKLKHVNMVFTVRGNWMVFNLADLAALRKTEANPKGKYDGLIMQKRFLNGLIALVEAGVVAEAKPDGLPDQDAPEEQSEKTNQEIQAHNEVVLTQVPVNKEISSKYEKNQPASLSSIGVDSSQATTTLPRSVEDQVAAKEQATREQERSEALSAASLAGKVSTELTDEEIDANLEALERVEQIQEGSDFAPVNPNANPLEEGILSRGRALAKDGVISGAELRRIETLAEGYKKIKNPWGPGLLVDYAKVTPEELVVEPDTFEVKGPIFDQSMLVSASRKANQQYIEKTMKKDIANSILNFQRAGLAITSIDLEKSKTVLGEQGILSVRWQPIGGAPSTSRIIYPEVNAKEGTFKSGGTEYRMRTQRVDVPIRVVAPGRVSLTSYYGKVSVSLSEREIHNYGRWLTTQLTNLSMEKGGLLKEVHFTNVFDRSAKVPKAYSRLAHSVHTMQVGDMLLNFKYSERGQLVKEGQLGPLEASGNVLVGKTLRGQLVMMNPNNELVVNDKPLGTIEGILGIDVSSAPHQLAMIKLRGQWIPLGVALASYMGLSALITRVKATVRRVRAGERMNLEPHEYAVRFSDESLILDTREQLPMLLLAGFRFYHKEIRQISVYSFDHTPAYGILLDAKSRNGAYTTELSMLNDLFVDPMTRDVLVEMKEPTEWQPLLFRAAQLLMQDFAPDEVDGAYMLLKGYERIPGTVYRELVAATRQYKLRSRVTKASVDMKPTAVWNTLTADSSVSPINNCNPIADIRAAEAVTYIGTGGRSKRSMVAKTRKFHKNDMGSISEQTVDSGDVAINVYKTANARIVSTRGMTAPAPNADCGISSLVSTAAMLSPGADIDDPKRVNFIGIQHGSGIGAVGYRTMPYSTGYEQVIAHRSGKKFAYVATGKGEVVSIKNSVLKVKYEDGSTDAVEVGRVFTKGEGHTYPNDLICTVKAGDTVVKGDVLVYNNWFFEPSPFAPRQVNYKHGVPVRVALYESVNTLEDASRITLKTSAAMRAYETEVRDIVIDFKTTLHTLVEVGEEIHPDDTLCTMEDPSSTAADLFSETGVGSLQLLVDKAPRAKLHGVVDKIEVLYNGELEDMSPSLRKVVEDYDRKLRNKNRDLGEDVFEGRADESMRVNNNPLQIDQLVIRIYISHGRDAFAGDKGVYGNQMKSVFSAPISGVFETESGVELDAEFSDKSIEDRIVRSPRKAGMMNALLIHTGMRGVKAYRGE